MCPVLEDNVFASRCAHLEVRRSANEDMYLAMYALDQDVLTPEFIRTYEHVTFNGWEYLQTEKASTMKVPDPELRKHTVIPTEARKHVLGTDAEFYGCRPRVETVWHLNPFVGRRFDGTHSLESISGPES